MAASKIGNESIGGNPIGASILDVPVSGKWMVFEARRLYRGERHE